MTWLVVIVGLLLLVFIHELGHFSVALAVGMRPRSFYVGFPPAIVKFRRKGIEYGIGAIPLGGLVRIPGMHRPAARDLETFMGSALREDPTLSGPMQRVRRALEAGDYDNARVAVPELRAAVEAAELSPGARRGANRAVREVDEGTGSDAYWRAPTWKRIAVIAAGPAANVLMAFLLFFGVYLTTSTLTQGTTRVQSVSANTPAQRVGLHEGDRIVAVDGKPTSTFPAVSHAIQGSKGDAITVTVERNGKRVRLGPAHTILSQGTWILGFRPGTTTEHVSYSVPQSARGAVHLCWLTVTGTGKAIAGLFHKEERKQLSGTIGIVRASEQALREGFSYYLQVLGFVSMSLALLNLLPFLPLDGGHILFSLIEHFRRRAVAREVYERVSVVGFSLILLLTFIALSNDLSGSAPR
jgi:regulator of sigma E protease